MQVGSRNRFSRLAVRGSSSSKTASPRTQDREIEDGVAESWLRSYPKTMGRNLEFVHLSLRKGLLVVFVFALASWVVFLAVKAIPGDPVELRLKHPDPAQVAAERQRLGLDRPLPVQWWSFSRSFVSTDWGESLLSGRPVRKDVAQFLPATIELSLAALVIGVVFGALTAVLAEVFEWALLRRLAFFMGTVGLTIPIFIVGLLALVVGSLWLGWFPSGGRFDLAVFPPPTRTGLLTVDSILAGNVDALGTALLHLALPSLCLSLYPAAQVCAVLQARLQDQRLRTLVTSLRARGFGPVRIWYGHVLRIVAAPVITVIGSSFGALLGGAVLTETVFSWPGIGRHLVNSLLGRDVFVIENVLLFVILMVVVVVFLADLASYLVNPLATRGSSTEEGGDNE